jgi:serine protease DegQ
VLPAALQRLWLLLAQAVTLGVAAVLVYQLMFAEHQGAAPPPPASAVARAAPAEAVGMAPAGSFRDAVGKAAPSVVNVYTMKAAPARPRSPYRFFFGEDEQQGELAAGLGSGVVVSADGLVLTNNHVIEGADQIAVALPGGEPAAARVLGTDPETDLAVLRIKAAGLRPIPFAPPDSVQVGDVVLALGNPFGVGQTVTQGIISATGRNRLGINTFENFVQTDAAINPGNSGGALVDVEGRLVGINTAIFSQSGGSQGVGFAIPASLASQVLEQIVAKGRVERGWLGAAASDLQSKPGGALISGVQRGGPAQKAGLQPGDIVVAVNGKPVADAAALIDATAALAPGTRAEFAVVRAGKRSPIAIELGRRPAPQRESRPR